MIHLPPQLTPSAMLWCEDLPEFVQGLLQGSRLLRREGQLQEAERCAQDAIEAARKARVHAGHGVALIHRADVYIEMGKPGPALTDYQNAHRIFRQQPSWYHHHNEAIAAYAMGLVHQLIGNEIDALRWYQEADTLLEKVKEHWAALRALGWLDSCTRVQRLIEIMSEHITAALIYQNVVSSSLNWVPIILMEKNASVVEQLTLKQAGPEIYVHLRSFQVCPLEDGWRLSLAPGIQYEGREISGRAFEWLEAQEGDHALVEWEEARAPLQTTQLSEIDAGGRFGRDAEGKVYAVRTVVRIIGGEESQEERAGRVRALLRPTVGPPGPAPSAEEPAFPPEPAPPAEEPAFPPEPPAPPSVPPRDSSEEALYEKLLRMVGGDEEVAERLIEYEGKQRPSAGRAELIERAIARLERDRM
jgi:tetratricopeptide (TPR) repeat protein